MTMQTQAQAQAQAKYEPAKAPTGASNQRKARCSRCHVELARGAGRQWDWSAFAYAYGRGIGPHYYCPTCDADRRAEMDAQPRINALKAKLEAWCLKYVNLGMGYTAAFHMRATIDRRGLAGETIAERLLDLLPKLDDYSYSNVIDTLRAVAAEIGPDGL